MGSIEKKVNRKSNVIMILGIPIVGFLIAYAVKEPEIAVVSVDFLFDYILATVITSLNWAGCRFIVVFLWKKYPWHIKHIKHLITELVVILTFTVGLLYLSLSLRDQFTDYVLSFHRFWNTAFIVILVMMLITGFHEALFFYKQWREHFGKSLILEKANIEAEYDTLKSQVNPHFLFNSLNTLLSLVEDNEPAEMYIYNLSDFLRYTLDNKNSKIKSIEEELILVDKYVFLQKSRFKENLIVDVEIPKEYYNFTIPTLVLQMLVDNSIKHNIISKDKPLRISIYIDSESYIVVENNLQKRYEAISTKQGLLNIKKRYAFLSEKEILISEKESKFTVKLPLIISKR